MDYPKLSTTYCIHIDLKKGAAYASTTCPIFFERTTSSARVVNKYLFDDFLCCLWLSFCSVTITFLLMI